MAATLVGAFVIFWAGFTLGVICWRDTVQRLRADLDRERQAANMRRTLAPRSPFGPVQLYGIDGGRQ